MLPQEWKLLLSEENNRIVEKLLHGPYRVGAAFNVGQYIAFLPITKCVGEDWEWWPKDSEFTNTKYINIPEISFDIFMTEFIRDQEYINKHSYQIY